MGVWSWIKWLVDNEKTPDVEKESNNQINQEKEPKKWIWKFFEMF